MNCTLHFENREKDRDKYMKFFKISLITLMAAAFFTACGLSPADQTTVTNPYPNDDAETQGISAESQWARENLDLQAVGALLEKADDAEEFEYLLNNSENGVNNLDLNGDGYADYISVREYDDRDDNERGFSLFSMFGPGEIQEIANIIFNRQGRDYPGAKVLLMGNDQIYGDDNYYETNWQDRSLPIVNWVFNDRDTNYQSPYYYENYPDYYEAYQVVDVPVYRTRIEQYYASPIFIKTNPAMTQIKIKSPNNGKSWNKIYSKLAKPTREQIEFRQNNPNKPEFVRVKKGDWNRSDDRSKGNPNRSDKPNKFEREKFNSPKKEKFEKSEKPKGDRNAKGNNGGGKGGGNKGGGKGGGKKG